MGSTARDLPAYAALGDADPLDRPHCDPSLAGTIQVTARRWTGLGNRKYVPVMEEANKRRGRSDKMRRQRALIAALSADVDRQLLSAETAAAAQSTRASILIGAAGLTSGFQVSGFSLWPAVLAALAALFGVALLTMRMAPEVPIPEAEETFWADPPDVALRNLLHWKHDVLVERESSLKSRRWVLLIGFALLASSICLELILSAANLSYGGGE